MIPPSRGIDFVILTGPLGSGKTTLLEHLLHQDDTGSGTAVIVNEAGAVNIDGAVLVESANGLVIETLSNGCVCCSLGNDLVATVQDLVETRARMDLPPFERIILECSGLSMPGEVVRSLAGLAHMQMVVSIICMYDCSRPPLAGAQFDAVAAQLSAANSVVLTKVDTVDKDALDIARVTVERINPFATIIDEQSQHIRSHKAFLNASQRPLGTSLPQRKLVLASAHPRIHVYQAQLAEPDPGDAIDWLENVTGSLGEKLLRCKALISTAERDLLMQTVGTAFSAPRLLRTPPSGRSVAIFITQDCALEALSQIPSPFTINWCISTREKELLGNQEVRDAYLGGH
ncbi:putative GTP-binding protein YjiA [Pseudomonas reidholzensis]|uniref:Putative GTP-binding protein YjiA n=1 Tax=Pseudomonas reidholzensis TaxID=1785162 RepID=A0A383RU02_9PSED|nr:GTP-binding protein [Pseudomonas reidholzensis]SYX90273.1 putative GTP-binding protein YjiA [Pseudomonas reidholzensis]